jgi:hypothetical protein
LATRRGVWPATKESPCSNNFSPSIRFFSFFSGAQNSGLEIRYQQLEEPRRLCCFSYFPKHHQASCCAQLSSAVVPAAQTLLTFGLSSSCRPQNLHPTAEVEYRGFQNGRYFSTMADMWVRSQSRASTQGPLNKRAISNAETLQKRRRSCYWRWPDRFGRGETPQPHCALTALPHACCDNR